ncbi:diguanylate cyclase [Altererythrobacter xixiisoli]|uniref:diguanylate cyclase n=1 Tax=Croceibacterium xixiisoli TaxID=1476466 RepID=A0A6I4U0X6_9SPHN|nr:GGDEF domain-containing protein [Croceibacterium xixiisoli]MXP00608.1 diguanylate cyclase [Croceibacterium xixiisoli]
MNFDLLTLYLLAISLLLLSAGMTLWERQVSLVRRHELALFAGGYAALATGCTLAITRDLLPGAWGAALCNLGMMAGYLLILNGVAAFGGRRYRTSAAVILVAIAAVWALWGVQWQNSLWSYVSALPIAAVCGIAAREVRRNLLLQPLRSRRVVVLILAGHGVFYFGRGTIFPMLVESFGPSMLSIVSKLTMYEGVLFAVGLPVALLGLIREEAHAKLLKTSRTDYLTALGNRRWFFEQGDRLLDAAETPFTLLAFDLDHFKAINDRFGHDAGDEVLKIFARTARRMAGPGAIMARMGGEEFAALLPATPAAARAVGMAVADHFTQAVRLHFGGAGPRATVSIGLAELGADGHSLPDLLSAADQGLYLAKARGRNRIEAAPHIPLAAAC